jgi:DNA repair protein RadC
MFGKSALKEAVEILPRLPHTDSLDQVRGFLRYNLHFSAESTRIRYASYIASRMFPDGRADAALRNFAKTFPGRVELREVCFYRFLRAEPLLIAIIEELLLPHIGVGRLPREAVRNRLTERFPNSRSIIDGAKAIVDALTAGGIAAADRTAITFGYREIPIPSFAFVLHGEFPRPGMYDIHKLEENRMIRAMLWNPERLVAALYELRNQGIISKVSEIDNIRQFTVKHTLEEAVQGVISEGGTR